MGYYGFDDTQTTYTQGQQTSAVSQDASAACNAVARAAGNAETGSSVVQGALTDFQGDVNTARGQLTTEIEGLGSSTSGTAATGQETENETAALQNQQGSLSRDVNTGSSRRLTA